MFSWTGSVLLLGAALALAQERQDVPTFASRVELVTVDAVVVDDKGRPVRGLEAGDFGLFEDGKPQPVASFEAFDLGDEREAALPSAPLGPVARNARPNPRASRSFVLLVDDMSLAPTRQEIVRSAIAHLLETGLRDGDELIFATTSGDAWWSARMPEGREDVAALAARVRGRNLGDTASDAISEWEAYRINRFEGGTSAARDAAGAPPPAQGPPGRGGSQPGVPSATLPGAELTDRVVERYLARRICDPRAMAMCYQLVRGRAQQVDLRRVNRTRDVLAAVDRAVFSLTGVRGRKSLLLLTRGS